MIIRSFAIECKGIFCVENRKQTRGREPCDDPVIKYAAMRAESDRSLERDTMCRTRVLHSLRVVTGPAWNWRRARGGLRWRL